MKLIYIVISIAVVASGCNKLVKVPPPVNTITTSQAFNTKADATAAVTSIYSKLAGENTFSFGSTSIFAGMYADELLDFRGGDPAFQIDQLLKDNYTVYGQFWAPAYSDIYVASACVEGLDASSALPVPVKNNLVGEAKFLRAFSYFYLVNLFGDVPLVLSTDFATTSFLPRASVDQVYDQMVTDLRSAQALLPSDYSSTQGQRTRANSFSAMALLARVELYRKHWAEADSLASAVISNTGLYKLDSDLGEVFLKASGETILQLENNTTNTNPTYEGYQFVPPDNTSYPNYNISPQLLAAFEDGDQRRKEWIDSTYFESNYYLYPYKYKVRVRQSVSDNPEYYVLLRLAEQFLIRAEARAQQKDLSGAIADLNVIRDRAGLADLPVPSSQQAVLDAVAQERRIEFFAEWGHRWFDLKRTEQANAVLSAMKPTTWKPDAQLWPIPLMEMQTNPNLKQNPGY